MNNRFVKTVLGTTQSRVDQSSAWTIIARDLKSGFRTTMHHALMASGIIAIGALGYLFVKPEMLDHVKALSPFSANSTGEAVEQTAQLANLMPPQPAASTTQAPAASDKLLALIKPTVPAKEDKRAATSAEQERVTRWISKRYRVARDATNMLVSAAYSTAEDIKLDPLLILSVMAIESRFNPFAESPVGAQGLMQVMSKVHHDKFKKLGGVQAALNPVANIKVGAQILKEYVRRGGSVEAGLKMYVGAAAKETDFGYGAKVLAEYSRLKDVAAGKKVPIFTRATVAVRPPPKDAVDRIADDKPNTLTLAVPETDETPV